MDKKNYKVWTAREEKTSHWGIQFIDGNYKGVVVEILNFTSKDHQNGETFGDLLDYVNGEINLSVEYGILHKPDDMGLELVQTEDFKNYFSDIVGEVVKETAKGYDKDRDNNFKEFNLQ